MVLHKIAVLSASLGGYDSPRKHVDQSMECDYFTFTDENFPPRYNAMVPRLQAKIPKFFGWQLVQGYDYYLWIDGSVVLSHKDSVKYFYDSCQGNDMVVVKHHTRPDIRQEVRYTRKGIKQGALYIHTRYENELLKEQYDVIQDDKEFKDDLLLMGGMFMYKNTETIQSMFKEWWYNVSRYVIQDQVSFPYVLKKSGAKFNVLDSSFLESPYLTLEKHNFHDK